MVVLGYDSTVPVSMDEMLHHARAVSRGARTALVIGDMPFGSYQVSRADTVTNRLRFMKDAGCDAVKLEGGQAVCGNVRALVAAGVPVMGHLGLTPQTAGQLGGFKVQGRGLEAARKMLEDARALEDAGVFGIVLECVPSGLARVITEVVKVPTIGIGAGGDCDGQVLVIHDMLGLFDTFTPSFVKQYAKLGQGMKEAVAAYRLEVEKGVFPGADHGFSASTDFAALLHEEK
jgi:3-methyl-2-oxobutanoate hydroxymethyltransferase